MAAHQSEMAAHSKIEFRNVSADELPKDLHLLEDETWSKLAVKDYGTSLIRKECRGSDVPVVEFEPGYVDSRFPEKAKALIVVSSNDNQPVLFNPTPEVRIIAKLSMCTQWPYVEITIRTSAGETNPATATIFGTQLNNALPKPAEFSVHQNPAKHLFQFPELLEWTSVAGKSTVHMRLRLSQKPTWQGLHRNRIDSIIAGVSKKDDSSPYNQLIASLDNATQIDIFKRVNFKDLLGKPNFQITQWRKALAFHETTMNTNASLGICSFYRIVYDDVSKSRSPDDLIDLSE